MDDLKFYGKSQSEIESLINTTCIYSNDISVEFGLDNGAALIMYIEKIIKVEGIELPNRNNIKYLDEKENIKSMGILQEYTYWSFEKNWKWIQWWILVLQA